MDQGHFGLDRASHRGAGEKLTRSQEAREELSFSFRTQLRVTCPHGAWPDLFGRAQTSAQQAQLVLLIHPSGVLTAGPAPASAHPLRLLKEVLRSSKF